MREKEKSAPVGAGDKEHFLRSRREKRRNKKDAATYRAWKEDLAKRGRTPDEVLAIYEAAGMTDYVKRVRAVIQQTEGAAQAGQRY